MSEDPVWTVGRRRAPEPGESLNGFASRVAAAEGLPNALELTSIAGAVWSHRPELSRCRNGLASLAACLRLKVAELEAMAYPVDPGRSGRRLFCGVSIDKRFIVHDERRFSPATLARRGIHLREWQLRPFPFCRESWELLASRCPDPDCGTRQRWYHASGVDLCDKCGEPLARSRHGTVPPGDRAALEAALDLVHPDPARRRATVLLLGAPLREADPGDLLDLLVAVAGVHEPDIRCPSDRLVFRLGIDPGVLAGAVASAWRILTTWPAGFEELAADRIATRAGRFGDGNHGATMRLLDVVTEPNASPVMIALVDDLRRSIAETVAARGIGCKAASNMPCLATTWLVALRRRLLLKTVFALDGDEPQPFLDRGEVETLSGVLSASVPLNRAAMILGVTSNGIEQFETLGLTTFEDLAAATDRDGTRRVRTSSLERLAERLTDGGGTPAPGDVRLTTVMRMVGGRLKPWGPVVDAMLKGRARYAILAEPKPLLQRVVVDPADVRRLAEATYSPPAGARFIGMMSKNDALEVLNLHSRHAVATLGRWPSATSSDRTVPVDEILEMSRRFVSLGELVARTGRPNKSVIIMLTENGVAIDTPWCLRAEAEAALFGRRRP